jgi:TetR/AcrR family fatty acid metabolism transcriptional regulator
MRFSVRTKTPEQAEKILNVAVRLFATHRFHEARMEDISAAAGVGKGTLYRYFKDKEELYLALLERSSAQIEALMRAAVEQGTDPRSKLECLVATIIKYFDDNPHVFDLIQHAEALQRPTRRFPWKARAVSIELTTAIVLEGQKTGVFRVEDPELSVLMFLGGLRAVFRFGVKPRPADLAQRIVDGFFNGAKATDQDVPVAPSNGHRSQVSVN